MGSVHFMSQSVDWATPEWLYKELDKEFHFDFDPCPLYGAQSESDGLSVEWGGGYLLQPTLRTRDWKVDSKSKRRSHERQDGCVAHS